MKLVHWSLMGGLLHWYSEQGTGRGRRPHRPLLIAVPNVTAHPPINGHCTNHRIDVRCSAVLMWLLKG